MQEQAPYKITPEQGWSQMKSLLDQEMPVQKRSRRMIFFWWSLAGIVLLGLVGVFTLGSNFSSVKSNTTLPVQQGIPSQTEHKIQTQPENKTAADKNEFAMNGPKQEAIISSAASGANSSSTQNEIISSPSKAANTSNTKLPNQLGSSSNHVALITTQNTLAENQASSASTDQVIATASIESSSGNVNQSVGSSSQQELDFTTEPIPVLDLAYFTIPDNEFGPIQASEFTIIRKHGLVIHPAVEVNVLTGFNGGTGLYAGAGADLKLSSTLNLTAGLGYRSFVPGANLFTTTKADLTTDLNNNGLVKNDPAFNGYYVAGESINSASYQDLDPVIESLHQWQAQIGIDWKFSKRFSAESGFGLAFHTTATSEYPIVAQIYAIPSNVVRFSNSLEGYDVIRKTMTQFYAGVSYHIGRHIALKAQWLHTFQPYLNTANNTGAFVSSKQRDDYLRGITIGLKYSFL